MREIEEQRSHGSRSCFGATNNDDACLSSQFGYGKLLARFFVIGFEKISIEISSIATRLGAFIGILLSESPESEFSI
jgi:hypothetical protein